MTTPDAPLSFLLTGDYKSKYPRQLVARFPHVAQRMHDIWNDKAAMADYLTELLVSRRPNRNGFPPEVAAEIIALSLAYEGMGHIKPELDAAPAGRGALPDAWSQERASRELEQRGVQMTVANFSRAAEAGDSALCMLFIHAGFDVEARDSRRWTPLMIAAFNGSESVALELIRFGANIHAKDAAGYTPLHWAAYNGYSKVLDLLLVKGGTADVASDAGITPMLQAAARGHVDSIQVLLTHRANPNLAARDGSTALLKAVANGHVQVIELLLKAGASIEVTMKNGETLRDIARKAKDPRVATLIARKAAAGWAGDAPAH